MFIDSSNRGLKKEKLDWIIIVTIGILLVISTLAILSATVALPSYFRIIRTHLIALPIAAVFFLFGWSFNYQIYQDQWKILYGIVIAALVAVLFFGVADRGSKSWFRLPFFSIQPSEMCRIGLIMVFANYLDKNANRIREPSVILIGLLLVMPAIYLVMKQPDFSSTLVTFPTIVAMLYCAGASIFHLFVIFGYGFIAAVLPISWTFISIHPDWQASSAVVTWFYSLSQFGLNTFVVCASIAVTAYAGWWITNKFRAYLPPFYFIGGALVLIFGFVSGVWVNNQMKEYQKKRLEVFFVPEADPKGAGYNILQAQIAMGSGGFFGKGVFSGTQARLGFVPERHTDFILAVVGEEMGVWGTLLTLGLYLLLLWRILVIAEVSRDQFGYLVCCGLFCMFLIYMLVNFGMLVGMMPVAGIPLPMVSYGGSNIVATLWGLGLVESIYARRMALV